MWDFRIYQILYPKNKLVNGKVKNFKKGSISIGAELAFDLDVKVGDKIDDRPLQ